VGKARGLAASARTATQNTMVNTLVVAPDRIFHFDWLKVLAQNTMLRMS
jgi:hypothetical protein